MVHRFRNGVILDPFLNHSRADFPWSPADEESPPAPPTDTLAAELSLLTTPDLLATEELPPPEWEGIPDAWELAGHIIG